jgi:hypothetical protein
MMREERCTKKREVGVMSGGSQNLRDPKRMLWTIDTSQSQIFQL